MTLLQARLATNNKLKPHLILTPDGNEERHEEGQYYLGYRNGTQVWEPAGNDPVEAQRLFKKKQSELDYKAQGGQIVLSADVTPEGTLREAIADFLEDIENGDWHAETSAKKQMLDEFAKFAKVKLLSQVSRKLCLTYLNRYLREQGNGDRTRFNKFLHLRQFLNKSAIPDLARCAGRPAFKGECSDIPVAAGEEVSNYPDSFRHSLTARFHYHSHRA